MGSDCNMNDPSSHISGKNPKFFKIILQDTIQEQRLAIPKKFVLMYENSLSNRIILKLPDGNKWEMELSKSENHEAWLQKGWKEFSDHYSLKLAFMLVFEYQDESNFHVFIFDATLVEIEYPKKPDFVIPNLDQNPSQLNGFRDTEIEDSGRKNLEFEGKCRRTISQSLEAAEMFSSTKPWFKVVLESTTGVNRFLDVPIEFVRDHTIGTSTDTKNKEFGGNLASSSKVNTSATNFTSSNPWFKVDLKSINMQKKYLVMPCSFIENHMKRKSKMVTFKVEDKSWPVKLNVYRKNSLSIFSGGVPSFLRDNSLKIGDVCFFELINNNNVFSVSIFRT